MQKLIEMNMKSLNFVFTTLLLVVSAVAYGQKGTTMEL